MFNLGNPCCWGLRAAVQLLVVGASALTLAACGHTGSKKDGSGQLPKVEESFGSAATYSRMFDATAQQTCEAARRALLSQGYIVSAAKADFVEGQKSFQPESERHVQMHIRVTCMPESADGKLSTGFVSALQDTFALKMASNSASVGVSMLGTLSVPVTAGHDSMIKIGSETITSDRFYESFFELMRRYLLLEQE
ncbi:MAG: DUF2242 domain-containing protein [Comamonas sp.]